MSDPRNGDYVPVDERPTKRPALARAKGAPMPEASDYVVTDEDCRRYANCDCCSAGTPWPCMECNNHLARLRVGAVVSGASVPGDKS